MSATAHLKHRVKAALTNSGFLAITARLTKTRIAILKYHSIQDRPESCEHSIGKGIIHSSRIFSEQMELVAKKFDPISIEDVSLFLKSKRQLPRRPVVITFDDGYADNCEIAAPILNRYGVPATFYVTVDCVDRAKPPWFCRLRHALETTHKKIWRDSIGNCQRNVAEPAGRREAFLEASKRCARTTGNEQEKIISVLEDELGVKTLYSPNLMLTWDQVRRLRQAGHLIGSHTMSHPNMAHISEPEVIRECYQSKHKIEAELNTSIDHFSYPSPILEPHWSELSLSATKAAGYQTAVTSGAGPVGRTDNLLALRRVAVASERTEFLWSLESTFLGRRL